MNEAQMLQDFGASEECALGLHEDCEEGVEGGRCQCVCHTMAATQPDDR